MFNKKFNLSLILVLILAENTREFRFMRSIQAIGHPYYKILMALGSCKEKLLFFEQKIWAKAALNRVLDIYYRSANEKYKVSRVEIKLVINNTSSFAYSEVGIGNSDFSATLYLPTNLNFIIYTLTVFTCNQDGEPNDITFTNRKNMPPTYMPFLHRDVNMSFLKLI